MTSRQRILGLALAAAIAAVVVGLVFVNRGGDAKPPPAKTAIGGCAADPDPCRCVETRSAELLRQGFAEAALKTLDGSGTCSGTRGLHAEALARTGKLDEAERLAAGAAADRAARRAQAIVGFAKGRIDQAKTAFEQLLTEDAHDVTSRYYLGVAHQRTDRYREARQSYLKALKDEPKLVDARYQLIVLTKSIGALDEARHHLTELTAIAPVGDHRLTEARALLAGAPASTTPAPSASVAR